MIAAGGGHAEVAGLLIDAGANIDLQQKVRTITA